MCWEYDANDKPTIVNSSRVSVLIMLKIDEKPKIENIERTELVMKYKLYYWDAYILVNLEGRRRFDGALIKPIVMVTLEITYQVITFSSENQLRSNH